MNPQLKYLVQKSKNHFWHFPKSIFFNFRYGFPSRKLVLIGVTGTDGKTTTASLIHEILTNAGFKTGLITTVGAKTGSRDIDTGLHMTSPDPSLVHRIFRSMVDSGLTHAVVEVTAHALDQFRYNGCRFEVSLLTNTSHEHLDDFISMDRYVAAKAKLFKSSKFAILNKDDASFNTISSSINTPFKTYSIKQPSDFRATNIRFGEQNLTFTVNDHKITTDSNYHYQIYNILAAYSVIRRLKIDPKHLLDTVKNYPAVKGRREEIKNNYKFRTIVDFAHTPAALESTLSSLKKTTKGNLICIFGATGGRDQSKRPLMGQVVSQNADIAIITSDDTRNEKVDSINNQIISGIPPQKSKSADPSVLTSPSQFAKIGAEATKKFTYFNIPHRQDAFNLAVRLAQPGDTIVACGKGHETTILLGTTEFPWSESEAFRTAFRLKNQ